MNRDTGEVLCFKLMNERIFLRAKGGKESLGTRKLLIWWHKSPHKYLRIPSYENISLMKRVEVGHAIILSLKHNALL